MDKKIYKYSVAAFFVFVFFAKMVISGAPVFLSNSDKEMMKAVIMQIEVSHHQGDDKADNDFKFIDLKCVEFPPSSNSFEFSSSYIELSKKRIDFYRKYCLPFHPSVATPPPNFS